VAGRRSMGKEKTNGAIKSYNHGLPQDKKTSNGLVTARVVDATALLLAHKFITQTQGQIPIAPNSASR